MVSYWGPQWIEIISVGELLIFFSSESFTNFETTNLQFFFRKTEFADVFLCTVNVNKKNQFRGKNW